MVKFKDDSYNDFNGIDEWDLNPNELDLKANVTDVVPYTGATQDVNLGEFGLQTGNIEFDLTGDDYNS